MGYYTRYELTADTRRGEILAWLGDDSNADIAQDGNDYLHDLIEDPHGHDSTKWYEHEDDVKRLSRMFPDVLFTLSGEGEENGDTWMFYCRNGQGTRVVPKVVWPDVDPSMVGPSASQADDPTKET